MKAEKFDISTDNSVAARDSRVRVCQWVSTGHIVHLTAVLVWGYMQQNVKAKAAKPDTMVVRCMQSNHSSVDR